MSNLKPGDMCRVVAKLGCRLNIPLYPDAQRGSMGRDAATIITVRSGAGVVLYLGVEHELDDEHRLNRYSILKVLHNDTIKYVHANTTILEPIT
jgi:hypothetical protein